jgi:hypothetical protein
MVEKRVALAAIPENPSRHSTYGAFNTIFTRNAYENARRELAERRTRASMNGLDPGALANIITIGGHHLEAGARKFLDWSSEMVRDFGESIRAHLPDIFERLRRDPRTEKVRADMTPEVEIAGGAPDAGSTGAGGPHKTGTAGNAASNGKPSGDSRQLLPSDLARDAKRYLREVKMRTGYAVHPSQLGHLANAMRNNAYTKLPPRLTKKRRLKFASIKNKLIERWELKTCQVWPRYTHDILSPDGAVSRRAGQRFDAHHLIENSYGGPHEWWNIHPARFPNGHQAGIHSTGGVIRKLFP